MSPYIKVSLALRGKVSYFNDKKLISLVSLSKKVFRKRREREREREIKATTFDVLNK